MYHSCSTLRPKVCSWWPRWPCLCSARRKRLYVIILIAITNITFHRHHVKLYLYEAVLCFLLAVSRDSARSGRDWCGFERTDEISAKIQGKPAIIYNVSRDYQWHCIHNVMLMCLFSWVSMDMPTSSPITATSCLILTYDLWYRQRLYHTVIYCNWDTLITQ